MIKFVFIPLLLFNTITLRAQKITIEEPIRYLALGDSYTIGQSVKYEERWPTQLFQQLKNLGYTTDTLDFIAATGWRTDDLYSSMSSIEPDANYNLVSLLIGVNNQFQGRNFSQYQEEFLELLNWAIALSGDSRENVFVVSIPDYMFTPFGSTYTNPGSVSKQLDEYNAYAARICDSLGIAYFYITDISRNGLKDKDLVASDGLHPSGKQYSQWTDLILNNGILNLNESIKNREIKIYPNPVGDYIAVEGEGVLSYSLSDLHGKIISKGKLKNNKINFKNSEIGVYLLNLKTKFGSVSKKIVIQ